MTVCPEQIHPPHQALFNAATISNVDLANRVALAPITRVSATADGLPTDRIASLLPRIRSGRVRSVDYRREIVSLGL